jgi:hypothetical protein
MISTTNTHQLGNAIQGASQTQHTNNNTIRGQSQDINHGLYEDEEYINTHFNEIMERILTEDENNNNINLNTVNNTNEDNLTNIAYQDSPLANHFQGDELIEKQKDHLRIAFQNINGLHAPQIHKWIATINKILELGFDITNLAETCINWYKKLLKQKYQSALHNKSTFGKLVNPNLMTSPIDIPYREDRVPGGIAMITSGK